MIYNLNYNNMPYVPKYAKIKITDGIGAGTHPEQTDPNLFWYVVTEPWVSTRNGSFVFRAYDYRNECRLAELSYPQWEGTPKGRYLYLFKNGSNNPERIWYTLDDESTQWHYVTVPDDTSGASQRDLVGLLITPPDDVNLEVPEIGQFYRLTPSQSNYNLPSLNVGYINYYDVWNVDRNYYTPTEPGTYYVTVYRPTYDYYFHYTLTENQYIEYYPDEYSFTRNWIIMQRLS